MYVHTLLFITYLFTMQLHINCQHITKHQENITFSKQLWENNLHIANSVLHTPFLRGISDGTLPVDLYGSFIVQDIYYSANSEEDFYIGLGRVRGIPSKHNLTVFFEAQLEGAIAYDKEYYDTWRIRDYRGIDPFPNTTIYVELEHDVALNLPPELLVVVMTPCIVLWDWLGRQLLSEGVTSANLYYPFVQNMLDPKDVEEYNNFIDLLVPSIDLELAAAVYNKAMLGELGMFLEGYPK